MIIVDKTTKHDYYVQQLCTTISPSYDLILTNVPLFSKKCKKRKVAEIDVLAVKDDLYDVYEVKCSYRIFKAKKQLKQIGKYLPVKHKFFFCGEGSVLKLID